MAARLDIGQMCSAMPDVAVSTNTRAVAQIFIDAGRFPFELFTADGFFRVRGMSVFVAAICLLGALGFHFCFWF